MTTYIDYNRNTYDKLAEEYKARTINKKFDEEKIETMANFILDYYNGKGKNFFEIGPGTGQILKYMSKLGFETSAVELSSKMAQITLENNPETKVTNKNILECNFQSKSFNLIYANALVHLFTFRDAGLLLNLIRNWLTRDGLLFINTTIHSKNSEGFLPKRDYGNGSEIRFRRTWREDSFLYFIESNGFEIVRKFKTKEISRDKTWIGLTCKVKN